MMVPIYDPKPLINEFIILTEGPTRKDKIIIPKARYKLISDINFIPFSIPLTADQM